MNVNLKVTLMLKTFSFVEAKIVKRDHKLSYRNNQKYVWKGNVEPANE